MKAFKKPYIYIGICIIVIAVFLIINYQKNEWILQLPNSATSSSCRAVDLNNDGILDIVVGAGSLEHKSSKNGVLAINGKNGDILWKVPCRDQVVGSAIFKDITNDGIKDVFIGGRTNQLWCINGSNGEIIWEYLKSIEGYEKEDKRLLNFFNPQFIPDQDGDGLEDILISFGGYVYAKANEFDRPPGRLFVMSSKTGNKLTELLMPDDKETYLSPVVYDFQNDNDPYVIFGSGGETIKGSLYAIRISALMKADSNAIKKLADGDKYGFIATPVLTDITSDNIPDIIVNTFDGRMKAFDGSTFELLWDFRAGYVSSTFTTPAPIDVNHDGVKDFFGSYSIGEWNDFKGGIQVLVDGKTGKEIKRFNIGNFQYSSPLVTDFTKDGNYDILMHSNISADNKDKTDEKYLYSYVNALTLVDIANNKIFRIDGEHQGSNLCSTPLITDLDNNGKIDIIYCFNKGEHDIFSNEKLVVKRIEINLQSEIPWGAYMGNNYDGIY